MTSTALSSTTLYRRVLLKISGEALMGDRDYGLDPVTVERIAGEIVAVHGMGIQICLVIGGGNIFRGLSGAAAGIERAAADHIGMLGTVINALAMQSALENLGLPCRVQSAIPMDTVCERFIRRRAIRHMEKGRVVVFAAGSGNPYFTTDTAAALRAVEMNCDALLKATQVDGVYAADPKDAPDAMRYDRLSYTDVLSRDLRVMDATAIALAHESKLPILVFSIGVPGGFADILAGRGTYTLIAETETVIAETEEEKTHPAGEGKNHGRRSRH